MSVELFHREVDFFDLTRLRARARTEVEGSDLIRRAGSGDRQAAIALHVGFWPFVREFELAIDRRTLPRQPLRSKFGRPSGATAVASINTVLAGLANEVRNMKEEEGSHAAHWCRDAAECGVASLDAP